MRFDRIYSLEIAFLSPDKLTVQERLRLSNLRIAFTIQKTQTWGTNSANIRIWNLSTENRARIRDYGDLVTLYAGYKGERGDQLLFFGRTTSISHAFDQPDIVSYLECGDGEYELNQKRISLSFDGEVPVRQVIQRIALEMGANIVYFAPSPNLVYAHGYSFQGFAKNALETNVNALNLQWSIQNGNIYITELFGAQPTPIHEVNADTGMIGVPRRFTDRRGFLYKEGPKVGWSISMLLRPEIIPGSTVRVRSLKIPEIAGDYSVYSMRHNGDTFGDEWMSTMEIIAL